MPKTVTNETELLSNPEQFGNPGQLTENHGAQLGTMPSTYLSMTDPEESIKALETMYELAMLQTDVDLDAELRANLTFEKICINELLKSI